MKICVHHGTGGAAPMLRRIDHYIGINNNSTISSIFASMGMGTPNILFQKIFKKLLPDVFVGAGSKDYAQVYGTTIHELAHASHFQKVGSAFWANYISYIVTYWGYGDGSGKNSGLCALSESWATYMEYTALAHRYNTRYDIQYTLDDFKIKKRPYKEKLTDKANWMPYGLFWDLSDYERSSPEQIRVDTDENKTVLYDKASGFSTKQMFGAMDVDVNSPQRFRDRLLKETNDRQKDEVNELFKAYYYN